MGTKMKDRKWATANTELVLARRKRILDYKLRNLSFVEIAKREDMSLSGARKSFWTAIKQLQNSILADAENARTFELEKLKKLEAKNWSKWEEGDQYAEGRILKIMERRSKYLGLEAPQKVDVREEVLQITVKQ